MAAPMKPQECACVMDDEDIAALRGRLLERRAALAGVAESAKDASRPVELDQARVGRLSRMDAMQHQEMARESDRRRERELQRIGTALARMNSGDYGYCLACDDPIGIERLRVDPAATQCLPCATRAERGDG